MDETTYRSPLAVLVGLLPLFAALTLVASVAHDFGFLLALGLGFDDVPSTLSEHVRSALAWAPKTLILMTLTTGFALFMKRVEGGLSDEELIATSPTPRFTRFFRRSGDVAVVLVALASAVIRPLTDTDDGWVFWTFLVVWAALVLWVLRHPRLGKAIDSPGKLAVLVLPIILSVVASLGYSAGAKLKRPMAPEWEMTILQDGREEQHEALGIRRFSTFSIVVTADRHVLILPQEVIRSVRRVLPLDIETTNACRWFGRLCVTPETEHERDH